MPRKRNTKKAPSVYLLAIFFKDGLKYNHWVGNLVMKTVDDVTFQKIKETRQVRNDKINNFKMEILDEGALDKVLTVPENNLDGKIPRKKIYEIIDN